MKSFKLFGLVFCTLGLSLIANAGTITVTKVNGGFFGYRTIKETHTNGGLLGSGPNHSLLCKDPGWESCKWIDSPVQGMNVEEFNNIMIQIDRAIFESPASGSIKWSDSISASWTTIEGVTTIIINVP